MPINGGDRGCHYPSIRYAERLAEAGINASLASKGDSYDNALLESPVGLYNIGAIRAWGPWRNMDAVEHTTLECFDWFDHRGLLGLIADVPPAEFEQALIIVKLKPWQLCSQANLRHTWDASAQRCCTLVS